MSTSFQRVHHKYRNFYTCNKKKENKLSSKLKQTTTSIMEIDHYQNALKRGLFSSEKEKTQKEKKKAFRNTRNFSQKAQRAKEINIY